MMGLDFNFKFEFEMNHCSTEMRAMQEYVKMLESQNETKNLERKTIYRELQSLEKELKSMEKYYHQKMQLTFEFQSLKRDFSGHIQECTKTINKIKNESHFYQCQLKKLQEKFELNQTDKFQQTEESLKQVEKMLKQEVQQKKHLQKQNQSLFKKIDKKEKQLIDLKERNNQLERNGTEDVKQMEKSIEKVIRNYQKIQKLAKDKQEQVNQLERYVNDLEYECKSLNTEVMERQQYIEHLERIISQLNQKIEMNRKDVQFDKSSCDMSENLQKVNLIKRNNEMVEKINQMEKENLPNKINRNDSERFIKSEYDGFKNSKTSPSKLKMRIQTLKMENETLLKKLVI